MIQIKNRYTGIVICELEVKTIKDAVVEAVKQEADLRGADLLGANLSGAYLYGEKLIIAPAQVLTNVW